MSQARFLKPLVLIALSVFALVSARAQILDNMVQKLDAAAVGDLLVVTVELQKEPTQKPIEFTTQSPARIVIDFLNTGFASGRTTFIYGQKNLQSMTILQTENRTRVILDTNRVVRYKSELNGRQYVITIEPNKPENTAITPNQTFASETPKVGVKHSQAMINGIDFRRGDNEAGRGVIDLSTKNSAVNIAQQGQNIAVDFAGTALPESPRKKLDVSDHGSPVQLVRASTHGNGSRVAIEPKNNWGYSGEKLSLNFQNIEMRALLQVFADFTNLNIVASDTVQGALTLRLKEVPWDQALEIVLQSKNLASRRNGNVLLIAPKDELAIKEKLEWESQAQVQDVEPLRSQVFQLNYVKVDDVRPMLLGTAAGSPTMNNRFMSKRGSVISDARSNQLFVTDVAAKLDELQQLIAKIDVPVRQVIIEARVVEADDKFSRNLGVKLGFGGKPVNAFSVAGNQSYVGAGTLVPTTSSTTGSYTYNNHASLSLPAAGINGHAPANLAMTIFSSALSNFVNLELSALEADGRGKILSSPRVLTANNSKALIEQGTELPYQSATSSGATSVSFRKANLKLEVRPKITPDGAVIMDVDINKDSVGIATTAGFAIDTKHVTTQVLVENGGTVVIGGIFQQTERKDVSQVPFLGDLPILGNLFKTTARTEDKSELLIFLTPRIV